jgi:glycosyltransferase involved in cell wall biosynthesis
MKSSKQATQDRLLQRQLPLSQPSKSPISIVIIAKDEEEFIGRCIQSVQWADDVVVVVDDSSCDRTAEIASALGVRVYQQPWLGWAKQKDLGVSLARHDWVCVLDADEIIPIELAQSISQAILTTNPQDAFAVVYDLDFLSILIPSSPPWRRNGPIKIFNRQYSRFSPNLKIHEKVECHGQVHLLKGRLVHWRGRSMDEYMDVYNKYTTIEAEVLHNSGVRANVLHIFARPILKFLLCYFLRGKFLFGIRGLIDALLVTSVEFFRYVKLWELQNVSKSLHPTSSIPIMSVQSGSQYQVETPSIRQPLL